MGVGEDPRIAAANDLVEMVMSAVQRLIDQEVEKDNPMRQRLIDRLTEMQRGLIEEMRLAVASNGHVSVTAHSRIEAMESEASAAS